LHVDDFHRSVCFSQGFLDIGIYASCPADVAEEKQETTTRTNHLTASFVFDPSNYSNHARFLDLVKE